MKVKQLGPNRTLIDLADKQVFISYETPVAVAIDGQGFFRTSTKWSPTTSRHINQWLDGREATEKPQAFFDSLLD